MAKYIKFHVRMEYGNPREYIVDECAKDRIILTQLLERKSINPEIRDLIEQLTEDAVQFVEVPGPPWPRRFVRDEFGQYTNQEIID